VIHEHDALELASAAIDFDLSPSETERLGAAIADCPVCAERALSYRRHMRLLAELPHLEAPDATRRRVMRAAMTGRTTDTRTPMLLLAAALLLGALLAAAAAVGGAFNDSSPRELPPLDLALTSPAPTKGAPSPDVVQPSPPSVGSGSTRAPLGADTIADVVSNNLRIRSEPRVAADSIKFEPLLKVGDRLFVIGGPVAANDYDWYEVASWRPTDPSITFPTGWVSRADHDGTTWIQAATRGCPTAPTIDVLSAMHRFETLACFGGRSLQLRGFVIGPEQRDPCQLEQSVRWCIEGPTWLAGVGGRSAFLDSVSINAASGPGPLVLGLDPKGSVVDTDLPMGRMSSFEGAFDHPDAATCTFAAQPSPVTRLAADDAVLRCRTQFVVSRAAADANFLQPQAAAVTTTDGLRVRSKPVVDDTSERFNPLLASGTRLFVLQGPVAGSGYDWYQVVAPGVSRSGGGPMVGWVAVASKTGQAWAKPLPLACPASDGLVSLVDLARVATGAVSDGGLSCFGGRTITTRATLRADCDQSRTTSGVDWLARPSAASMVMTDGGATFTGRISPENVVAMCAIAGDASWNVEGHFDDPDSSACGVGSATDPAVIAARYECRTNFVVTLTAQNGQ
jgi:hypothetical protein